MGSISFSQFLGSNVGSISFSQIFGSRVSCEACGGNVGAIKLKKNIFYSRIKLKKNNSNMMYSWIKL